jgi:hypothetical protein
MQRIVIQIIKKISKKYNVPEKVVQSIVESPFKFTREDRRQGNLEKENDFRNYRYPYIGLLCTTPQRIVAIKNKLKNGKNGGK